jgi:glycosyltransferase involved in cell wall biosynthesis
MQGSSANTPAAHFAGLPQIAPTNQSGALRPLVSVMFPVFEPDRRLVAALRSVLRQDLGRDQMQIAVLDDGSAQSDIGALIAAAAAPADRIEMFCADRNRGLAANWNECIRRSRGEVVHILHQDDWIDEGFYARLLPPFARHPLIGMAFCRHSFADENDRMTGRSHRERWSAGPLNDWLRRISERQRIQCASALVRRCVYEQLGGYRGDLKFALDWEMWVRIAARFQVWYEPKILAHYRRHQANETARLRRDGTLTRDVFDAIAAFAEHLPERERERLLSAAYAHLARRTLKRLQRQRLEQGEIDAELEIVGAAIERMSQARLSALLYRRRATRLLGK